MKTKPSALQLLPAAPVLLALYSAASVADDSYRAEINLGGSYSSETEKTTTELYDVGITYYLDDVSTKEVPLREAAFLDKASFISISYAEGEQETASSDADTDGWGVRERWVLADKYILGAHYVEAKSDKDPEVVDDNEEEVERYGLELGMYIDDFSSISIDASLTDISHSSDELNNVTFRYHTVTETYQGSMVSGDVFLGTSQRLDANTVIEIGGSFSFYVNDLWSIGGGFALAFPNNEQDDENKYSFHTDYFITENIAVTAGYSVTVFQEADENSNRRNSDEFALSITGRI